MMKVLFVTILLGFAALAQRTTSNEKKPDVRAETQVDQVIDEKKIENMPLSDRRSMNMIGITGASVFVSYQHGGKASFSLGGGRTQSQSFQLDGGNGQSMRLGGGQMDFDPPSESLSEVKVISNGYSAEFGGSAGGVIAARVKSGSNRFRVTFFEYLRNQKLDAANFFAPIEGDQKIKAPLRYNVFGGTFGGPIRRDKTFFFLSNETSLRREGTARSLTVPTALQRSGDFSQTLNNQGRTIPIYDPATTRLVNDRYLRDPFAGNIVPSSRFDPVAVKVISFYPAPNTAVSGFTTANNFRANSSRMFDRNHLTAKIDHLFTEKDRLSFRYLYETDDQGISSIFPNPAAENQLATYRNQHNGFGSWTRNIRPNLMNDFRFTYSHRTMHQVSLGLGGDWPAQIGLEGVPQNAFPRFQAQGFSPMGAQNQEKIQSPIRNFQFIENLTWIRDKHSLKFGLEFRPSYNSEVDLATVSGSFQFNLQPTGQPSQATTGNSLASMLLGFPSNFTQRVTQELNRSSLYAGAFVQDNWRLNDRFLLNFGLRWEMDTPMVDSNNRINGFDMNAINPVSGTPGVVKFAGIGGWPTVPYTRDWNNFGPRAGFAWRPDGGRTIFRGGYGVFFGHPFDRSVTSAASLGYEFSRRLVSPDNGITAPFYLRAGVPAGSSSTTLDDSFGAVPAGQAPTTAVTFFESGRRSSYAQQFNFGIQRTVWRDLVLDASYLGNLARKLSGANLSINQIRPELLGPGATQSSRPYPQFSDVQVLLPDLGNSSYHAGVLRLQKRYSAGLQLLATYTWSKFLNNVDEGGGGGLGGSDQGSYSNLYDRRGDWGPSDNDIRHRFTWSSVWDIPLGSGHRYLPHGFARLLASGWSVGSIVTLQSGAPFTVTAAVNTTNSFSAGPLRADVLYDPNLGSAHSVQEWFDTAAFAQPALYSFGNQGVNILRADGLVNFDFSLVRSFTITERVRLQFRGELFNAFNHPNFELPGHTLGTPDFGIVDSAGPGRRVQLGLRLTF